MRPLILGRVVEPVRADAAPVVVADGQMLRMVAKERIELRVGKSSLVMEATAGSPCAAPTWSAMLRGRTGSAAGR